MKPVFRSRFEKTAARSAFGARAARAGCGRAAALALGLALAACNAKTDDAATECEFDPTPPDPACGSGLFAVQSDYTSTEFALLHRDGTLVCSSFMSSGSAMSVAGLSFAFSGDVAAPSSRPPSGQMVLVDRYGTDVITWLDPRTRKVRAQLPVGTGFKSNPQDYLEIGPHKAYVPRYEENAMPGAQPFDSGDDVLVIDPSVPSIVGSIPLPKEGMYPPRGGGIVRVGDEAIVTLEHIALDFQSAGDSELAVIGMGGAPSGSGAGDGGTSADTEGGAGDTEAGVADTEAGPADTEAGAGDTEGGAAAAEAGVPDTGADQVITTVKLTGLKGCGGPALSPSGRLLAVACAGELDENGALKSSTETDIVLLDATVSPPSEVRRLGAFDKLSAAVQSDVAFASESRLLAKTQTALGGADNNRLVSFALDANDAVTTLAEARPGPDGKGQGLKFGGIFCDPGCGGVCLLADADRGVVRRFSIDDGLKELDPISLGGSGLPPVGFGAF